MKPEWVWSCVSLCTINVAKTYLHGDIKFQQDVVVSDSLKKEYNSNTYS